MKRLILSFLMNLIFAWSLYLLGWQVFDSWAFLLIIPLVLSVVLTLSAGHWAIWGAYNRNRIALSAGFNALFAWVCYLAAKYDMQSLPVVTNGLNIVLLMAVIGVFAHWAIGYSQERTLEKRKRNTMNALLHDLSDEDSSLLEDALTDEDSEVLRKRY